MLCKHEVVGSIPSGSTISQIAYRFATAFWPLVIDIVKEEYDRPSLVWIWGFQVTFEVKTLSDKNQAWACRHLSSRRETPCMSFAEKRSNVEGLLTDALA